MRIGTLAGPPPLAPQMAMWTASAPAWAHIDPALPQVERQPPAAG